MNIIFQLTDLLYEDASSDRHGPEYRELLRLETRHLEALSHTAGEDIVEKLTDVQGELLQFRLMRSFLYGLRLGAELLDLQT